MVERTRLLAESLVLCPVWLHGKSPLLSSYLLKNIIKFLEINTYSNRNQEEIGVHYFICFLHKMKILFYL